MLQCYCGEHLKAVDRNESFKMTQLMCPKDDGQTMHFGAWMFDPKLELAKEHGRMKKPEWLEKTFFPPEFEKKAE